MAILLDSSVSLTWCLHAQASEFSMHLFQLAFEQGALVPASWHIEMGNIRGLKVRDGNLSRLGLRSALASLSTLLIETDKTLNFANIGEM